MKLKKSNFTVWHQDFYAAKTFAQINLSCSVDLFTLSINTRAAVSLSEPEMCCVEFLACLALAFCALENLPCFSRTLSLRHCKILVCKSKNVFSEAQKYLQQEPSGKCNLKMLVYNLRKQFGLLTVVLEENSIKFTLSFYTALHYPLVHIVLFL